MNDQMPTTSPSIYEQMEAELAPVQEEDWDYEFTAEISSLIHQANSSYNLSDFLDARMKFQALGSNNGWNRKTYCPFHKHGHERTASFFVNTTKNVFFCQACGVTGSLVQYIAMKYGRPEHLVATHLLELYRSGHSNAVFNDSAKKLAEKKKAIKTLFELVDIVREFMVSHIDDELAIEYVHKAMAGFDATYELHPEGVEKKASALLGNIKIYLERYDKR